MPDLEVSRVFKYDGDGNRIVETTGGVTTAYLGNYYEWTASGAKSYYYAGNVRIAMRDSTGVRYLLGDHLGSTTLTTDSNGNRQSELRYYPYGKTRYPADPASQAGAAPTTFRFTGQRWQQDANDLYFYNARWYDPLVGRFLSADTIVPDPKNPQALNRYSYVGNSPLRYTDPSGHAAQGDTNEGGCSTPGSPKCILDKYYRASTDTEWLEAVELLAFLKAHPEYELIADQQLGGMEKAIVVNTQSRNDCASGSTGSCFALAVVGMMGTYVAGPSPFVSEAAGPSGGLGAPAKDVIGDPDCAGCGFLKPPPNPQDVLMPGGQPIGTYQRNSAIRTVPTQKDLDDLFKSLTVQAQPIVKPTYSGQMYTLPGGGTIGIRQSAEFGPTLDIDVPGIPITRIHLPKK